MSRALAHQITARPEETATASHPLQGPRRPGREYRMSESLRLRSLLAMGVSAAAILGLAAPAYEQDATPTADTTTTVG